MSATGSSGSPARDGTRLLPPIPALGTGTTVAVRSVPVPDRAQLRDGPSTARRVDFMISTGNAKNEASGDLAELAERPDVPAQCGIDVALVLDLSSSVTGPH